MTDLFTDGSEPTEWTGHLPLPANQRYSGPQPQLQGPKASPQSFRRSVIDEYAFTRLHLTKALGIPVDPLSTIRVRDDGGDFIVIEVHYSPPV